MAQARDYAITIIGAGAAGLMAAIFAGRHAPPGTRITLLDGAKRLGAKILVSGGGRCNVTHAEVSAKDYAGSNRNQIAKVLRTFPVEQTVRFFHELNVPLKREDTGKLFPETDRAKTVLEALLREVNRTGAEILTEHRVLSVEYDGSAFAMETPQGEIRSQKLILATGGKSLPKTGSDGQGYELARSLGHTVNPTFPALVPLVLEPGHWLTTLSGLTLPVELTLFSGRGQVLHRHQGSMLLTHFGLSGPVVMDLSRYWIAAKQSDPTVRLHANLLPGHRFDEVEQMLVSATSTHGRSGIAGWLSDHLPRRLAVELVRRGIDEDPAAKLSQLSKTKRRKLAHVLTSLPLPVIRDRGYLFAEATAGGVPLSELHLSTMASRCCPGLYLCGEMLDVDGRIGGFNFQWAWCSGRLAGMSAAIG
ncbi:MAG: NAD(P)/FAD-dependent oxidoreductase [Phycisphaeraceae bacterium]